MIRDIQRSGFRRNSGEISDLDQRDTNADDNTGFNAIPHIVIISISIAIKKFNTASIVGKNVDKQANPGVH